MGASRFIRMAFPEIELEIYRSIDKYSE
jgi:hypothetical protein